MLQSLALYGPVATTPQTKEKVIELFAGSEGKLIPEPCKDEMVTLAGAGQVAPPVTPEQLT